MGRSSTENARLARRLRGLFSGRPCPSQLGRAVPTAARYCVAGHDARHRLRSVQSTRISVRKVRLVRSHLPIPTGLDCPLRQMWQLFSSVTSVRFERLSAMPTIVVATYQQNILIFVFFKKKVFNLNIYPNFKLTNIDDSLPYICN